VSTADFFKLISGELREEIARRMSLEVEVQRIRYDALANELDALRERVIDLERNTLLEKEKLRK
jgi:hypothetical protein